MPQIGSCADPRSAAARQFVTAQLRPCVPRELRFIGIFHSSFRKPPVRPYKAGTPRTSGRTNRQPGHKKAFR